ncbi:MAG TPA: hypothetical protein VGL53_09375 [Bryobacteraceae bacterium]|jgi:hypothetical protein
MKQILYSVFSPSELARGAMEFGVALLLTAIICFLVYRNPRATAQFDDWINRARGKRIVPAILFSMLLPLVVRVALLPILPPPRPVVHDEFGHLLVSETLEAGRLANPPHPLWKHLETIYVIQQPHYASNYPIGQGIMLAAGKIIFGNPWAGVLLSTMLMCGAITWMLYGCLPPAWAAIGGALTAAGLGLKPEWLNSYWGGAFCAFGGALLFGALCRLWKSPSIGMAAIAGLGWAIVWLTRPFESVFLCLFLWAVIAAVFFRNIAGWRKWLAPVAVIVCLQLSAGGVSLLHNHAVTGSYTTLPYQLGQKLYGGPQSLMWQKPIPEPPMRYAELKAVYAWQREGKDFTAAHPIRRWASFVGTVWSFFVTPWYSLPLLVALLFVFKDRLVLLASALVLFALVVAILFPFFFPHYFAAYTCVIVFLIASGTGRLYQWKFRGRAVGAVLALFLMSGGLMMAMRIVPARTLLRMPPARPTSYRPFAEDELLKIPGQHVVFVRYGPEHSFLDEWVYNGADIDGARIIWMRATDPADQAEVTRYYPGRHFWIADVDRDTARMAPYRPDLPEEVDRSEGWIWKSP